MVTSELQIVLQQAQRLAPNEQLQLIKHLADKLSIKNTTEEPRYLIYGEFAESEARKMSTEDDFKIAETTAQTLNEAR